MNNIIETHYCSHIIVDPNTGEDQQYFGSVTGEYASGKGRFFDSQGNLIYFGDFKSDLYDGYGKKYELINTVNNTGYTQSYQCIYEGNLKDWKWNGQGKWYWDDGNLYYEGNFENGTPEGIGTTYTKEKIVTYKGSFSNGNRNGQGTSYWPNGNIQYSGEFLDGKFLTGTEYSEDGELLYEIE